MNKPGQVFNVSTRNVTVRHSTLVSNDFAVGSECSGGCEDISLLDSVMSDARGSAIDVLRLKSAPGRGGYIRNILVQNVTALALKNTARPPDGFRCTVSGGTPVTNVSIINVHIGSADGIAGQFVGDWQAKWKGLTLKNVSVGNSKHPSWECMNVEGASFMDVTPPVEGGSCAKFAVNAQATHIPNERLSKGG
jgi:polygalacturonase